MPYTNRVSTSKLLIELEMFDEATQVLDGLLEEDDEVVETWYLLGWVNRLRAMDTQDLDTQQGYNANVRYYLLKAKRVHTKNPTDDEDLVKHVDELLEEIGPGEEEEEVDDGEDDWEDVESSDEENQMDE